MVMRTIKQHSYLISDIAELQRIAEQYQHVKNYVYSRYAGINSFLLIRNCRQTIRDPWVETGFAKQWKLPARYWKQALDESISNIKSVWSNAKHKTKSTILGRSNLTDSEKNYSCYILKADKLLYNIMNHIPLIRPVKIAGLVIREHYIHNLIRRLMRRYKGKVPYSYKATSFQLDADMYSYAFEDNHSVLYIQGINKGHRVKVVLKDQHKHTGNLRIVLTSNALEVHTAIESKVQQIWQDTNVLGLDKGYHYLLAVSNGRFYGDKLNDLLSKETERLNGVNKKRNKLWALAKVNKNITKHNLGKLKYNRQKQKHDARVKSYINAELNRFYRENNPSEVVSEDLSFVSWNDKFPKHIKRKLSRWIKGYIRERLEFKNALHGVTHTVVNAAYTSQTCHRCGLFGKRNGETFTCPNCGRIHADYNASQNILKRKNDLEISLYTPYKKVKQILELRVSA